jgi:hypothetical protein
MSGCARDVDRPEIRAVASAYVVGVAQRAGLQCEPVEALTLEARPRAGLR